MASPTRPHIGPEWTLVAHGPDTVELRTGVWNSRTLTLNDDSRQGRLWPVLKALRDGRAAADIATEAGVPLREVESLVDQLIGLGVMEDRPRSVLDTFLGDAFNGRSDTAAPSRVVLLEQNSIHDRVMADLKDHLDCPVEQIVAGGEASEALRGLDARSFTDGLQVEELRERFAYLKGALVVAALEQNNPVRFQAIDDLARTVGFTWMHATVDGPFVYIGPTVVPFRTASYRTFETRVAMNIRENESYLKYKAAVAERQVIEPRTAVLDPLAGLVASHVALEVINWMATGSNFTVNKVLGVYLPTMEIAYHEIMPLPGESLQGPRQNRDSTSLYFDIREWLADDRVVGA
ncbi:hypothetical protein GCM10010149_84750 [Nonomuraea roseoviolacea subsp. roseoviolacea]|uniref:hypothetical protein n=1 Tax=Nonomuraea roseoviolacea TaxID=103837 RepID=UPI0031D833F6